MAEERLETLVVEESEGKEAQAAETTQAAEPPTPKRATVASLKKELDEFKRDVNDDVLSWIGELDIRLEGLETTTATHNKALLGDVKTRLDIIEEGPKSDRQNVAADIADRLDALETAIEAVGNIQRSHLTATATTPPAAAATPELVTPPPQTEEKWGSISDLQTIATQSQTMTDVLMMCRILKEIPELTDEERNRIIEASARAAGVHVTPGIQIRAGVRNTGA